MESNEIVIVSHCGDCPMYGDYMIGDCCERACYHPSNPASWDNPFDTCPLKEKGITIQLAGINQGENDERSVATVASSE